MQMGFHHPVGIPEDSPAFQRRAIFGCPSGAQVALLHSNSRGNLLRLRLFCCALPAFLCLLSTTSQAAIITEDFATDPLIRGWRVFGDSTLFAWNQTGHNLSVTWDSSRSNSYYYVPLGTILNRLDDFSLELDLELQDITGGVNPNKPSTF